MPIHPHNNELDVWYYCYFNLFFINRPIPFYDGEREDFETCYKPMDAAQYTLSSDVC